MAHPQRSRTRPPRRPPPTLAKTSLSQPISRGTAGRSELLGARGPKMQMALLPTKVVLPRGGIVSARTKESVAAPRSTPPPPGAAGRPAPEVSSMDVDVGTGAPTRAAAVAVVAAPAEAEQAAGAAVTSGRPQTVATTRSTTKMMGHLAAADTGRVARSITQPVPATAARHAAKARSTRRSPNGGGSEGQKRAARAAAVSTRRRRSSSSSSISASPAPRMAPAPRTPP